MTAGSTTLTWIDSREAYVVRWQDGEALVEHLESDVPAHHRTTGHVRHDAARGRGGTGVPQVPVEARRLEHLSHFVAQVAARLPADDDLLLIGPGTVREHLASFVADQDDERHRTRQVACRAARPLTVPQLVALLRHELGEEAPRKPIRRRLRLAKGPSRREARTHIEISAEENLED
jgi:hypothetical protein